jgi:hypothetical protein
MASAQTAGVPADVSRRSEEEEGNLAGMEQEEVVETAQHGSGSVPAGDFSAIYLRVTTGPQESGLMMSTMRFLTTPMPRVMLEAAAVRSVPLPRLVGAATTAVVRTIETQKLGRQLS